MNNSEQILDYLNFSQKKIYRTVKAQNSKNNFIHKDKQNLNKIKKQINFDNC